MNALTIRGFVNLRNVHKFILKVLAVASLTVSGAGEAAIVIGDVPLDENPHAALGLPSADPATAITISRRQYALSWDFERRVPQWVAWTINKRVLGDATRTSNFRIDRDLDEALVDQNQESVVPDDYTGSCLDRGHQVPSADRTASKTDNQTTFLMSNIMPQSAYLNRRLWVALERFLRRRVMEKSEHVQVFAGAIVDPEGRAIGPNKDIQVPLTNYKIAVLMPATRVKPHKDQMRYFVVNFPNITSKGTNPVVDHKQACYDSEHTIRVDEKNRSAVWRKFLIDLKSVESKSHVDFDFLKDIHQMSAEEVDQLIGEDTLS